MYNMCRGLLCVQCLGGSYCWFGVYYFYFIIILLHCAGDHLMSIVPDDEGRVMRDGFFKEILHKELDALEASVDSFNQAVAKSANR